MTPSKIIEALGGTAETARLCEVEMAAVSQWKENGIPKARMMFLKLARPDVFKQLEKQKAA
jgi:phage terminase Nu1 subunit (DNA packaging protein)